ncbi:hypothetical protein NPIL_232201, partial [Nephila pilipes]
KGLKRLDTFLRRSIQNCRRQRKRVSDLEEWKKDFIERRYVEARQLSKELDGHSVWHDLEKKRPPFIRRNSRTHNGKELQRKVQPEV